MHEFIDVLRSLTDPDKLRALLTTVFSGWWGYALLFSIVFAETGLLVGFFLPGDSLLFTVGVVAGAGDLNIVLIDVALIAAALIGDAVAYQIGHRTGDAIFSRPDSRLFRREHVTQTHEFYEKHGGKTIIYAKFVPIVRTFAPFIAGVARMPYRTVCGLRCLRGDRLGSFNDSRRIFPRRRSADSPAFRESRRPDCACLCPACDSSDSAEPQTCTGRCYGG